MSEDGTKLKNNKGGAKGARNSPALTNDYVPMTFGGESKSLLLKVTDWVSYDIYRVGLKMPAACEATAKYFFKRWVFVYSVISSVRWFTHLP